MGTKKFHTPTNLSSVSSNKIIREQTRLMAKCEQADEYSDADRKRYDELEDELSLRYNEEQV